MDASQGTDKTINKNKFPSSVFVGYAKQINQLNFYLKEACKGRGKFVVINGEQGCGKSTFVDYFRKSTVDPNITFMNMHFSADDSFAPYLPFIRLINELQTSNKNIPVDSTCNKPAVQHGNNPEIDLNMEMLDKIQNNNTLIQQRIITTLFEYTHQRTLVVLIDNIHFAGQSVWQFFHYLADKSREEKILFIATLRQDGRETFTENKPVYSDILRRMNRDGFLQKITMERLSLDETKAFLHSLFKKTDFSADFISMLFKISRGIPGQISNYLKILFESQKVFKVNDIWFNKSDIDIEALIQDALYSGDVQNIKEDFNLLSAEQQKLLKYASLMSGSVNNELLAIAANIRKITTIKELRKVVEKKFIIENIPGSYEFKKSELKTIIRNFIPDDQQSKIHLEIAERIKESTIFNKEEKAYRLAFHYSKSNYPQKAVEYLIEAGDYSIQKMAFMETKDFYQQAFYLLSQAKHLPDQKYARLYIQYAWLNRILGNYNDTLEICEKANQIYGSNERDRTANLIRIQKGFTYFRQYNWRMAKENLDVCMNNADTLEPFEKAIIYFGIGNIHFELGEYTEAKSCYTKAQIVASEIGASSLIALLYNHLGTIENITGNALMAIALYSKAIPLYEKQGNNSGLAQVYHNIGITYADEQNWEEANNFCGKSLSVSGMMGLTPLKSITFLNRALALTQLGRLDEAHEYNFKAIRLLELLNDELGIAEYHKIQGMLEAKESNWEESMHNFELAIQRFKLFENKLGYAETLIEKGLTQIQMENRDQALISLREANKIFTAMDAQKKAHFTEEIINEIIEQEFLV